MQPYYYITVKYPESNQKEFMMNVPFGYMGKESKRAWSISNYDEKRCKFDTLKDLYELIDNSIVDDPPYLMHDGGIIKDGYNWDIQDEKKYNNIIFKIKNGEDII